MSFATLRATNFLLHFMSETKLTLPLRFFWGRHMWGRIFGCAIDVAPGGAIPIKLRFALGGLFLTFLTSCSSAYVDATGPDAATLRFTPGGYVASIYRDASECTDRSIVHQTGPDQSTIVKLPTGSEQAMTLAWGAGNPLAGLSAMCRNTFSFRPEKSKSYEVSLVVGDTHCAVSVLAVADANGPLPSATPIKISPRETIASMSERGPWCEPRK
jgi:hypothetical protein